MKKNDIVLIMGTLVFSFLFYKQSLGINYFLYSIFIIFALGFLNKEKAKSLGYKFSAFLFALSGVAVFIYANALSVWAYCFTAFYFIIINYNLKVGPINAALYSVFSFASSFVYIILDFLERRKNSTLNRTKSNKSSLFLMIFFVSLILLVFFFLYQKANPVFKEITKNINLEFLDLAWFFFTTWGLLMTYAIIYPRVNKKWTLYEVNNTKFLDEQETLNSENKFIWMSVDIELEKKTGIILFALLNFLILFINIIDVSFLWSKIELPEGLTFSEYLHQGIYTLIFSCVLAILLIVFIFRGHINFNKNNLLLKNLAFIWIAQNIIIGLSCAYRNYIYISNYGLTYKRLTIYILLVLLIIGLISAILKIINKRNFYYLFRLNSFAALTMLVTVSLVNWDLIIAKFNLKNSNNPDIEYLANLSSYTLPEIFKHIENDDFNQNIYYSEKIKDQIFYKYDNLLEKESSWKSFNYKNYIVLKRIRDLYLKNEIKTFRLYFDNNNDLEKIKEFTNLVNLEIKTNNSVLTHNFEFKLKELEKFTELKYLKLTNLGITEINGIKFSAKLKEINLSNNEIKNASNLKNLKELRKIDISLNPIESIEFIKELNKLEQIDLSHTKIRDLVPISESRSLKKVNLSSLKDSTFSSLGALINVRSLNLSNNKNLHIHSKLNEIISNSINLNEIIIDNVGLNTLEIFSMETIEIANKKIENTLKLDISSLNNIKTLSLNSNNLANLRKIEKFISLEKLTARDNKILTLDNINKLRELHTLDLRNNPVSTVKRLSELSNLKSLHLSNFTFSNISPIKDLTKLETLTLSGGTINDAEKLGNLKNLKYLDLSSTTLNTLEFIKELDSLEVLIIEDDISINIDELLKSKNLKVLVYNGLNKEEIKKLESKFGGLKILETWNYEELEKIKETYTLSLL